MIMPELKILRETLNEYKNNILDNINFVRQEHIAEDIKKIELADLNFTYDKIDFIIVEISQIVDETTHITLGELKQYYRDYELSEYDINNIKTILRRMNNRNYAMKARYKKKLNSTNYLVFNLS